jgi:hypothetical protein
MKNTKQSHTVLYCCGCNKDVSAALTTGKTTYPHRKDLFALPFWQCPTCLNFVGCHHKTKDRTAPLGCIPTPAIKKARQKIHTLLDPLWKNGQYKRKQLYQELSDLLGYRYHTADVKTLDDAQVVVRKIQFLRALYA